MKTLFNFSFIALSTLFLFSSCAKERPIEYIPDPEGLIFHKDIFLGTQKITPENRTSGKLHRTNNKIEMAQSFWFSKVTVVHVSNKSYGISFAFPGLQSDLKIGFFKFTGDQLFFYNGLVLEKNNLSNENFSEVINTWDIEHIDFRLAVKDGRVTNQEEKNQYIPREQKRYFKINWGQSKIKETNYFPVAWNFSAKERCWKKLNLTIDPQSVEASEDYIGFTVIVNYRRQTQNNKECPLSLGERHSSEINQTVHYKYSFMRVKEEDLNPEVYKPYVYDTKVHESFIDPVDEKYCHFKHLVKFLNQNNEIETQFLMTRWNPNKEHFFYFDSEVPEEYKEIFNNKETGIFTRLNQLFKKHNLPTRFHILENTGQKLGDLRYPIIKIVSSSSLTPIIGYGPSDVNPLTGEIISANIIVWEKPLYLLLNYLKKLLSQTTETETNTAFFKNIVEILNLESHPTSGMNSSQPINLLNQFAQQVSYSHQIGETNSNLIDFSNLLLSKLKIEFPGKGVQGYSEIRDIVHLPNYSSLNQTNILSPLLSPLNEYFLETESLIHNEIKINYENKIKPSFNLRKNTVLYPFNENAFKIGYAAIANKDKLNSMDDKTLIRTKLYNLSMHEVGHTIGALCHNFMGSFDKKNFKNPETSYTSSIMDYLELSSSFTHSDFDWGKYDKAALLFAYSGGEKNDKGRIDLAKEHPYLNCNDYELFNVFCNPNDSGTNFSAVMLDRMIKYHSSYYLRNRPDGKPFWNLSNYKKTVIREMVEIKNFLMALNTGFRIPDIKKQWNDLMNSTLPEKFKNINLNPNKDHVIDAIHSDLVGATLMGAAFLNAVIRENERPFNTQFTDHQMIKSVGINFDKHVAGAMLFGTHSWIYNPEYPLRPNSYSMIFTNNETTKWNIPKNYIRIFNQITTERLSGGYKNLVNNPLFFRQGVWTQYLFSARKSMNPAADQWDWSLTLKAGVQCTKKNRFFNGIKQQLNIIDSNFEDFQSKNTSNLYIPFYVSDEIAVFQLASNYFYALRDKNPYSYELIKNEMNSFSQMIASDNPDNINLNDYLGNYFINIHRLLTRIHALSYMAIFNSSECFDL